MEHTRAKVSRVEVNKLDTEQGHQKWPSFHKKTLQIANAISVVLNYLNKKYVRNDIVIKNLQAAKTNNWINYKSSGFFKVRNCYENENFVVPDRKFKPNKFSSTVLCQQPRKRGRGLSFIVL